MTSTIFGQTYQVNGNAVNYGNGLVRMTTSSAGTWQTSSAWSTTKQDLTQPFDMSFDMFFGCENGPNGGDGMTFTFQNAGINAIGGGGGFLGIGGGPIVSPAISIEFDTYDGTAAGGSNEIPADHIAIDVNGDVNNTNQFFIGSDGVSKTVQAVAGGRDLEDCATNANNFYTIRIVWDPVGKTLKLYEEGVLTMTYTNDIVANIFGGNSSVYWGFTGATGTASNEQWIAPSGTIIPWSCSVNSCCTPFTVTPTGPTMVCSSPITLGTTGSYSSYSWSTGQTSSTINISTPGTYTVNVLQSQAGQMCPGSATFNITTSGPTATISGGGTICNDGTTTTPLSVTLTGTSPWTLTYAIDGVAQTPITGITTSPYVINGKAQHTYTLSSVSDNAGCNGATSGTAQVNAYTGLPIGHDNTFVAPGSTTLTVDNGGGTYQWYDGGVLVNTGTSFTTPTLAATKTYTVVNTALTASVSKSIAYLNNTQYGAGGNNTATATGLPKAVDWLNFTANSSFTLNSVSVDTWIIASPQAAGSNVTVYLTDNTNPALSTSVTVPVSGFAANTTQSILVSFGSYNIISGHSYQISYEGTGSAQGIMYWDFVGPRGGWTGPPAVITKDPEVTITVPNQGNYPGIFNWQITTGSPAAACGATPVTAYAVVPAPITLLEFTAAYTKPKVVTLHWSTTAEINNNYYTVQRSTDGIHFIDILVIPGAGNSNQFLSYNALDEDALAGVSYYRLKQTDFDGKFTYSNIVKVSSAGNEFSFMLSPNLCNDQSDVKIFIAGAGRNEKIPVEIFDVLGRKIYSTTCLTDGLGSASEYLVLSGAGLTTGTYIVVAYPASGKEFKQKIVYMN
ncbi:MAG TPA: hypothetical protein VNB90_11760 [Cytophagaceae bacterium]|nr:hypothetical protein [Cytophagaceae bacterium]